MKTDTRVVLITGCSTGIGHEMAREFAARGCRVVATARRPETLADVTGEHVRALRLDVTDAASIAAAVADVLATEGRIDVLVNNAGYGQFGPIIELPLDDLRRQLETNVVGALAVAQAVAPSMIAQRSGLIVNVGSVSGLVVTPFSGAYGASKAALHGISDALRLELEPFGLRVVTLQPGAIRSAFSSTASASISGIDWATSSYASVRQAVEARARTAEKTGMAPADFARETVDLLLAPEPPVVDRRGPQAAKMVVLSLLPTKFRDKKLRALFGLDRLR